MFGFNPLYAALFAAGLAGAPSPTPVYSLDFMTGVLPAGISFTRSSQATRIGPTGLMEYAPHNLVRNSRANGAVTGTPGTLPTNWAVTVQGGISSSVVSTGAQGDGNYIDIRLFGTATTAGDLLVNPDISTIMPAFNTQPVSFAINAAIIAGALPAGRTANLFIVERNSGGSLLAATQSSALSLTSSQTRVSMQRTFNQATAAWAHVYLCCTLQIGDVVDITFRVSEPQVEIHSSPRAYAPTSTGAYYGPRFGFHPQTLAAQGILIEAGRTNLAAFWRGALSYTGVTELNANAAGADGTAVARTLQENSSLSTGQFAQGVAAVAFTSGVVYTVSRLVKPGTANRCQIATNAALNATAYVNFSLTGAGSVLASGGGGTGHIQPAGNGYYLCSMTFTSASTNSASGLVLGMINSNTAARLPTYQGTGLTLIIDGHQIEAGSFPTSLIPTFGASATRVADALTTTSLAWLNPAAGTAVSEYMRPIMAPAQHVFSLSDNGSFNNIIYQAGGSGSPGQRRFDVTAGAVNQAQVVLSGTQVAQTVYKDAMRWEANNFAASENGGAVVTDVAGTIPSPLNLLSLSTGQTTMYMRRFSYYNTALTNSDLVTLSTV